MTSVPLVEAPPASAQGPAQGPDTTPVAAAVPAPAQAPSSSETRSAAPDPGEVAPPAAATPSAPPAADTPPRQPAAANDAAAGSPGAGSPGFLDGRRAPAQARARAAWRQPAAVAGLLVLLGLQIVLADRDRLAADAQWRPLVAGVCGVLGCSLPPWREPDAFVLLARDVRPHPQQAGALRASASFRNDARWPQPWPQVLLTLSDVDGRAVAARAFTPEEYLGGAPDTPLLAAGQSVDIALDIGEPSTETVSYAWDLY